MKRKDEKEEEEEEQQQLYESLGFKQSMITSCKLSSIQHEKNYILLLIGCESGHIHLYNIDILNSKSIKVQTIKIDDPKGRIGECISSLLWCKLEKLLSNYNNNLHNIRGSKLDALERERNENEAAQIAAIESLKIIATVKSGKIYLLHLMSNYISTLRQDTPVKIINLQLIYECKDDIIIQTSFKTHFVLISCLSKCFILDFSKIYNISSLSEKEKLIRNNKNEKLLNEKLLLKEIQQSLQQTTSCPPSINTNNNTRLDHFGDMDITLPNSIDNPYIDIWFNKNEQKSKLSSFLKIFNFTKYENRLSHSSHSNMFNGTNSNICNAIPRSSFNLTHSLSYSNVTPAETPHLSLSNTLLSHQNGEKLIEKFGKTLGGDETLLLTPKPQSKSRENEDTISTTLPPSHSNVKHETSHSNAVNDNRCTTTHSNIETTHPNGKKSDAISNAISNANTLLGGNNNIDNTDQNVNGNALLLSTLRLYSIVNVNQDEPNNNNKIDDQTASNNIYNHIKLVKN